jgi:hypothetical protein
MIKNNCPGCGSSPTDRESYAKRNADPRDEAISTGFTNCPHCGSTKCCMCDMGDDVECISCGFEGE